MLVKIILVAASFAVLVLLMQNNSHVASAWRKLLYVLFIVAATIAVIFPDALTRDARLIGFRRGADLVLYATVAGLVLSLSVIYTKFQAADEKLVGLARHVAILEADLARDADPTHKP